MDGAGAAEYDPGPPPRRRDFPRADGGAGKAAFGSARAAWYRDRTGNEYTSEAQYNVEVRKRKRTQGAAVPVPVAVPLQASPHAGGRLRGRQADRRVAASSQKDARRPTATIEYHGTGEHYVPFQERKTWEEYDSELGHRRTIALDGYTVVTKIPGHPEREREREREREKATQEEQVR
jgi:hypothetical protein